MKGSVRAAALLRRGGVRKVHSIYRHTVNLTVKEDGEALLLAVHPDSLPLTPLSLAVALEEEEFSRFAEAVRIAGTAAIVPVKAETPGGMTGGISLLAGGTVWESGSLEVWNPLLTKRLAAGELALLAEQTNACIREYGRERGGFGDAAARPEAPGGDLLSEALRERVRRILACGFREAADMEETLLSLVGLGQGLTPSGDDFLTGFLLALRIGLSEKEEEERRLEEHLKERIRGASLGTNDVSRQYLLCACRGEYGAVYHELLEASGGQAPAWRLPEALCRAAAVGQSSGVDTLNGLLTGLRLIQKKRELIIK